jgi:hypothetical protein
MEKSAMPGPLSIASTSMPAIAAPDCARMTYSGAFAGVLEDVGGGFGDHDRQPPRLDLVEAQLVGQLLAAAPAAEMSLACIDREYKLR